MHYEDLIIKEIKKDDNYCYAIFNSKNGGTYAFPIANSNVSEDELANNGIVIGKTFLGVVVNNQLAGLDGFSFVETSSKIR